MKPKPEALRDPPTWAGRSPLSLPPVALARGVRFLEERIVELAKRVALRRGLRSERRGDALVLVHPEAPLYIEVRETSRGVRIRLVHENIRDYIREIVDSEQDPRDYVEGLLDEIAAASHELAEKLRELSVRVELDTRTTVMDVLDELEEAIEE